MLLVLAHMHRGRHDDSVAALRKRVPGVFEVRRIRLVPVGPDQLGDVVRDLGSLPFDGPVGNVDVGHGP